MSESPYVIAVVLTWNDTELTTNCLRSLVSQDYENLDLVLVDNGSTPPVGPELAAAFDGVELVQLEENRGFSGGANEGMQRALERGADYVHVIGNDSVLDESTISRLVAACESHPDAGAVSPLHLDPGEPQVVQFYTATLDRDTARHFHHQVGEIYDPRKYPTVESDFIPMVALMFRASALREVGLLDERFGTCWEDFDLCLRFRDQGWRYLTVGGATAVHIGSHTTGITSPYITYYTVRNRLICLNRYASSGYWWRNAGTLLRSFWFQIRGYGLTNWVCHRAFLHGCFDYFFRVRGEQHSSGSTRNA